jgi:hypothetical protein
VRANTELWQEQAPDSTAGRRRRRGRRASTRPSGAQASGAQASGAQASGAQASGAQASTARPSSAERRCRGAVAAAMRAQRPGSGRRQTDTAGSTATTARLRVTVHRAALRTTTGLALVALGLILLWAVHASASVVNVHMAGLVLIIIGAAWLLIPVRDKRALARRLFDAAMTYLSVDVSAAGTAGAAGNGGTSRPRCSLDDLLTTEAAASMPETVSALPAGLPVTGARD